MALAFGIMISWQTIKIVTQQRYVASVNVSQFSGKSLNVITPDLFAEKNMLETFRNRYKGELKFVVEKNDGNFFNMKPGDAQAVIYPSYAYGAVGKNMNPQPIDEAKVPNLAKLMDIHLQGMKDNYSRKGAPLAFPLAYVPYAIFFNSDKIKPTTAGKEYFNKNLKVALSDDSGAFLALLKFSGLQLNSASVATLKKTFTKENCLFYDFDKIEEAVTKLIAEKPAVIVAPVYLKSLFERRIGSIEMILPDEGSYATLYLVSALGESEKELTWVFMNHLTDPLIQKNYADIFTIPVTSKVALNTMSPVLYNALKMNDPEYFKKIMTLKDEKEYETAVKLFKSFREGL